MGNPSEDDDLTGLLNLSCLKNLTIDHCKGISFDGGLLPILKKFGSSSLESLALRDVQEVNIPSTVKFCSELRELCLDGIQRYIPSRPRTSLPHHLPHLRHLTIRGHVRDLPEEQPSCSNDLSLLLSSAPALERITLIRLRELNDGILEGATGRHGFRHLKSFQAELCPGITKGVVDRLLELDNPLSMIVIEKNNYVQDCSWVSFCDPAWEAKIKE